MLRQAPTLAAYVRQVKPAVTHPDIIIVGANKTMSAGDDILNRQHEADQVDYAMCKGFQRGCGENIREAITKQCYEQLAELPTLMYKLVDIIKYFVHAHENWVFLNETMESNAILNYNRDMEEDQHLTAYINQLNHEQLALKDNVNIIISEADKKRQFMTQTWSLSDLFDKKVMKDRMKKEAASRK